MYTTVQTQEEAAEVAVTFLELSDPYKVIYISKFGRDWNPSYWTYTLREVKPDEDGWLFRFWRISGQSVVTPPFGNVYVYRATGEVEFRDHGYVHSEEEAVALAKAFAEELGDYTHTREKLRYKQSSTDVPVIYTPQKIKLYREGWLIEFYRSIPGETFIHQIVDST